MPLVMVVEIPMPLALVASLALDTCILTTTMAIGDVYLTFIFRLRCIYHIHIEFTYFMHFNIMLMLFDL